jgi:hypothetical protein
VRLVSSYRHRKPTAEQSVIAAPRNAAEDAIEKVLATRRCEMDLRAAEGEGEFKPACQGTFVKILTRKRNDPH